MNKYRMNDGVREKSYEILKEIWKATFSQPHKPMTMKTVDIQLGV